MTVKPIKQSELKKGMVIYFEYEHNYNHRSRALRYKRGLFLEENRGKAVLILQSLGGCWNKSTTICNFNRLYVKEKEAKD